MTETLKKNSVAITIDGLSIEVSPTTSILEAARELEISLPTLCYKEGSRPDGNCRACVVEIEGERALAPSCKRLVSDGMIVHTTGERVDRTRNTVLELLAVESNLLNKETIRSSTNELAGWLSEYDVEPSNALLDAVQTVQPIDETHPGFLFDPNRCINCDRCVRACQEEQVNGVISIKGRGPYSQVIFGLDSSVGKSPCVGCGECVQACPTDALIETRHELADQSTDSICPYCGVGCALTYKTRHNKILAVEGRNGPANKRRLCVKGRFGFDYTSHKKRLTKPLIRKANAPKDISILNGSDVSNFDYSTLFREATWEEALQRVVDGFSRIKTQHGPSSLAGFGSAKGSNEEAYLFQKLIRTGFGTNNVDHCTRLCHASSVSALLECIGSGAVSNQVQDIQHADVALLIGCNPTVNHPVAATWMKNAVNTGTKLIVADPRNTEIGQFAELQLLMSPGSDIALINGMLHTVITENLFDQAFVDARTEGLDGFKAHIVDFSPEKMSPLCGIPAEQIRAAARLYASAGRAMIFWGMGVSQHTHGTDNVRGLIALAGLTGNFGKRGTGLHPLRGQNNVQGASDAGLIPMMYPNYQPVSDTASRSFFETLWGSHLDPKPGLTVVEIMHAIVKPESTEGKVRGLYVMGENPAMSDPNLNHSRFALASLEHLVVQDIFMTETALLADVVLPSSAWPEKTGTVTNTDRTVQLGRQALPCPGDAQPDLWIIQQIAAGLGLTWDYPTGPNGVQSVFEEMRSAMGDGFKGITWDRLETEGAVTYPCRSEKEAGQAVVFVDRFPTNSGRLKLVPTAYRGPTVEISTDFPLRLITGRVLEHWHTGTMTRRSRTLDSLSPEPIIAVSGADAEIHEINDGQFVTLKSPQGTLVARVQINETVCQGTVFLPFAFNEAAANLLTSDELDPKGKIPEFKHTPVSLTKQANHHKKT